MGKNEKKNRRTTTVVYYAISLSRSGGLILSALKAS